jgi:hypothetical protein
MMRHLPPLDLPLRGGGAAQWFTGITPTSICPSLSQGEVRWGFLQTLLPQMPSREGH